MNFWNRTSLENECKSCARVKECGITFRPMVYTDEHGHCDGCECWEPVGNNAHDATANESEAKE